MVESTYDAVVLNGKVIDGSGNRWSYADVGIKGGKIVNQSERAGRASSARNL